MGNEQINQIIVYANSPDVVDEVAQHIRPVLKRNHEHGGDFRIQTGQSAIEQFNRVVFILNAIGGGIAGISLLVGGIGIMNIMLVSVNERTREIGIRKALGAKRTSILSQFIIEAIVLCLFGGALGIVLGITIGNIISAVIQHLTGEAFQCIITPGLMLFAIFYSSLIGLFFGVYPAWRASKLDPIEALRYE
jgi:putative ABC transport system permease protein